MKVEQSLYRARQFSRNPASDQLSGTGQRLVLGFGAKAILENDDICNVLKERYPAAEVVLCSTSGEIYDELVYDDTLSLVAIEWERTTMKSLSKNIRDFSDSFEAGRSIFAGLNDENLSYVLVISDGGLVNGSELVRGIDSVNTARIPVTGGLAGDGASFNYTLVGCNSKPERGNIVAIGFYGKHLKVGHGSLGGWDTFGPEKTVTRSAANHLFEIDGKNALDIYKRYLGKYADELPGSALLFPLSVRVDGAASDVVRTILTINNDDQSMVFAGDVPEGAKVRFMKANFDSLIDAATHAAGATLTQMTERKPRLALLVSCVGRKLILGKRIDEETEAVKNRLGTDTLLTGFYSYGEISPLVPGTKCELHNQTMTITTFDEAS